MTNGEKLKEMFPYLESDDTDLVKVLNIDNLKSWWNAEYKEPITKNDLEVDCISRQVAIDAIRRIHPIDTNYNCTLLDKDDIIYVLNDLPSVTPQELVHDKLKAEITTLQHRCYALTKGTMCVFCKYECEYKAETEKT